MRRTAPLEEQAAHAEREAFDHALAPYFSELLQAARREVRHRLTIGQFEPDNPTPEELLEKALQYAWRERRILSPPLGIKAWALASVFRTADALGAREAKRRRKMTECLPEELEPDPLYQQDDEDFWQLHELDHPRNAVVFRGPVDLMLEDPTNDDELVGRLAPREREVLLMHEVHGVALQEVALARNFRDRSETAPIKRPASPAHRRQHGALSALVHKAQVNSAFPPMRPAPWAALVQ